MKSVSAAKTNLPGQPDAAVLSKGEGRGRKEKEGRRGSGRGGKGHRKKP